MIAFLDANVLIYLIEGAEPFAGGVRNTLQAITHDHENTQLAMSALSGLECRVGPMKSENSLVLDAYDEFFSRPGLTLVPLSDDVLDLATAIRARHGIKTPDALQAACCLQLGSDHLFITGDRGFRRIPGLHVRALG